MDLSDTKTKVRVMMSVNQLERAHDDALMMDAFKGFQFSGITDHSAHVQPGMLFVAYPGQRHDGRAHIQEAIAKGAAGVVYDPDHWQGSIDALLPLPQAIPTLPLPNCRERLSHLGAHFYGHPSAQMTCAAVTGTNGKTSTVNFITQMLGQCQKACGMISTLGYGLKGDVKGTGYTTPDALSFQKYLSELRGKGAEYVAFEASSHALDQGRLKDVCVDVAVFTNLSQDHLDYHGSIEAYRDAKKVLFEQFSVRAGVINIADPVGLSIYESSKGKMDLIGYGDEQPLSDFCQVTATDVTVSWRHMTFTLKTVWGEADVSVPLTGRYQIQNILAAIGTLLAMGIGFSEVVDTLSHLAGVQGRMDVFGGGQKPVVIVDYAHTPAALASVLSSARELCQGQLWCVFGCGGDRDTTKRPQVGQVAERFSDHMIITDDNPRSEDPAAIVRDIQSGLLCPWAAVVEHDRCSAIAHAISRAKAGDVVVICGKGHETYQELGERTIALSDSAQVQLQLSLSCM